MDLGFIGKTAIITGGGSNINRANVLTFAREGANLVCADIDVKQGQRVVNEANTLGGGGRTILVKTDVTNWESVQAMVKKTLEEFGKIDVLVNGVGWIDTPWGLFREQTRDTWEKMVNLNYWSTVNCTRAVLDHMIQRRYGKIINIGSEAGRTGEYRQVIYSGCKGAVISFTKALAKELGRYNINVNCLCPAGVVPEKAEHVGELTMTQGVTQESMPPELRERIIKMYPIGRLCLPQDVANAVLFLASDVASFITGQTLSVNGGYSTL